MMRRLLLGLTLGMIVLGGLTIGDGGAQDTPPISVNLDLNKTRYILNDPTDPITIVVTIKNTSCPPPVGTGTVCQEIIANAGFSKLPVHLLLTFVVDGKPIIATELAAGHLAGPPPPVALIEGVLVQVDPVEILAGDFVTTVTIPNAYAYYPLIAGNYSVEASLPIRTYPAFFTTPEGNVALYGSYDFAGAIGSNKRFFSIVADADGDGYFFPEPPNGAKPPFDVPDCDDNNPLVHPGAPEITGNGIDDDCNPATPDVTPVAAGTIVVRADKHTVGSGAHPGSTKEPLRGLLVNVFNSSPGSCVSRYGVSWQNYKSIWLSCTSTASGLTDGTGTARVLAPPGDYVLIGEYNPIANQTGDEIYIGVSAGGLTSGSTMQKYLQVIVKADGKTVPAKYTTKTGSELLIIEPEYVEWDGTTELYPFIFESDGDWSVSTSVDPPPGFIADYHSLSTDVNTAIRAVQFTVTDVGSEWVPTDVTHRITHGKKSEIIKGKIGVKLSEGLARAKGLSRFGNQPPKPPGPLSKSP